MTTGLSWNTSTSSTHLRNALARGLGEHGDEVAATGEKMRKADARSKSIVSRDGQIDRLGHFRGKLIRVPTIDPAYGIGFIEVQCPGQIGGSQPGLAAVVDDGEVGTSLASRSLSTGRSKIAGGGSSVPLGSPCRTCAARTIAPGTWTLVWGGWHRAWHFIRYAKEQSEEQRLRYAFAEEEAKAKKSGLWVDGEPVPPWEWRRR